jgi:hypothetical protein
MALVTIDEARAHCKSDASDDAVLQVKLDAAHAAATRFVGRTIFESAEAMATALTDVAPQLIAANAAYRTAVEAAEAFDNDEDTLDAVRMAKAALFRERVAASNIFNGIVVTDDIKAAILLLCGHFYRNREEVETGNGASAVQVPMGARALLQPHVFFGEA